MTNPDLAEAQSINLFSTAGSPPWTASATRPGPARGAALPPLGGTPPEPGTTAHTAAQVTAPANHNHICFAVIDPGGTSAGLRIRHSRLGEARNAQLQLAFDVAAELPGYPWTHFHVTELGLVLISSAEGRVNRAGTELAHRLGAGISWTARGPVVIHAVPGLDGLVSSLSDWHLRQLAYMAAAVHRSIRGGWLAAA